DHPPALRPCVGHSHEPQGSAGIQDVFQSDLEGVEQPMNELSRGQLQYLNAYRRGLRIIRISRILIFLSFLFIWEFTSNVGIIDSFIFSSPSRIALCFWEMVLDESIFLHMGVTLYETILSFLLV